MKIIVAGGRDFNNYNLLCAKLDYLLQSTKNPVIVCGEAKGADLLGRRYAVEHNLSIDSYPAKWEELGKSAGFLRNEQMAKVADALVAFWDGKSKGTEHMIRLMKNMNKPYKIVRYGENK